MKTPIAEAVELLLDGEDARLYSDNDDTYRRYERILRSYWRMAWDYHDCSHCRSLINPGNMYQAYVWVADPPRMICGKLRRFWVEKHHYPMCPDQERDMEEEMRRQWEREDAERRAAERRAA
jgi:hypothetical protein